jgi:MFS family permease
MVGGVSAGPGVYDVALKRRQALMGASGPLALVKNMRVFSVALFACIGGLLYGYNQGVFSGVLAMPSFMKCQFVILVLETLLTLTDMGNYDSTDPADSTRKGGLVSILELGAWLGTLLSGFMAETISRKYGIIVATCVFILGVVIQTTAVS